MRQLSSTFITTIVCALLGCGASPDSSDASSGNHERIARQDQSAASTTMPGQYWTYSYDGAGFTTASVNYDDSDNLKSTSKYDYANGLRSSTTTVDPQGTVLSTSSYEYDSDGISDLSFYGADGTLTGHNTYVFMNGRKMTTNSESYTADQVLQTRTEFEYDAQSGRRLSATTYDSTGTVTGISTRTYSGALFTQTTITANGAVTTRKFKYEQGALAVDVDDYFEF